MTSRRCYLGWGLLGGLLAGCPATPAPGAPGPLSAALAPAQTAGGGSLHGTVALQAVQDPYFGNSRAAYGLLALAAGGARLSLTTPYGEVYTLHGEPVTALTDDAGAFAFEGTAVTERGFLVQAQLAGGHRLSAVAFPGQGEVTLDEASSMIAQTLVSLAPGAALEPGQLDAARLDALRAGSVAAVRPQDLVSTGGSAPVIEPLQTGNGLLLRGLYVRAWGQQVSLAGSTLADGLSDAWKRLVGFRPLALTREAGGGTAEDTGAAIAPTLAYMKPTDGQLDDHGDLWIAEGERLRFLPRADRKAANGAGPFAAGQLYTRFGAPGALGRDAYYASYDAALAAAVTDPAKAPAAAPGEALPLASRVMLEPAGASPQVFVTSLSAQAVFLLPATPLHRFGRDFLPGHAYRVAGTSSLLPFVNSTTPPTQYDDPATPEYDEFSQTFDVGDGRALAPLYVPAGLTQDARHNLYVLDAGDFEQDARQADPLATAAVPSRLPHAPAGRITNVYHASVRLVRASDGHTFTLRLQHAGAPYDLRAASDVAIVETSGGRYLYVADTAKHAVIRIVLPSDLETRVESGLAPLEVEVVLGALGQAGFTVPGAPLPDVFGLNAGMDKTQVLLDSPAALAFDAAGNLLVADRYRLRLLDATGRVFTLAGGLESGLLEGDSRLCALPHTAGLGFDAVTHDLVLADRTAGLVRRLHTARGSL